LVVSNNHVKDSVLYIDSESNDKIELDRFMVINNTVVDYSSLYIYWIIASINNS